MAQNFEQYEIPPKEEPTKERVGGFVVDESGFDTQNLEIDSGGSNMAKIKAGEGANSGGINAAGSSTDIVFWAGATHPNRATAPFRVDAAGNLVATSVTQLNLLLGVQTTDFNVSNGAVDEVVFSVSVPANSMGSNGGLRVVVAGTAPISSAEATASVKIKFGGTTIITSSDLTESPQKRFKVELEIYNRNATNSQIAFGETILYDLDNPTTVAAIIYGQGNLTAAVDTTVAQTLQVTASESGTSGGANPVINYVVVEKLR